MAGICTMANKRLPPHAHKGARAHAAGVGCTSCPNKATTFGGGKSALGFHGATVVRVTLRSAASHWAAGTASQRVLERTELLSNGAWWNKVVTSSDARLTGRGLAGEVPVVRRLVVILP